MKNSRLMKGLAGGFEAADKHKHGTAGYWKALAMAGPNGAALERAEQAIKHANESATEGWKQKRQWELRALDAERKLEDARSQAQNHRAKVSDFFDRKLA